MMHVAPIEPWGKLDRTYVDPSTAPRLSLIGHSIDVAAVTRALLELPTWRARFDRLAGRRLSRLDIERLTVLAFWHDVGKAGVGFYVQGAEASALLKWCARFGRRQFGHTRVVAPFLRHDKRFQAHRDALGIQVLAAWSQDPVFFSNLWLAAVSHHGQPLTDADLDGPEDHPTWLVRVDAYDPLHGLAGLGQAARVLWPGAFCATHS